MVFFFNNGVIINWFRSLYFGEALIQKINQESYFTLGTLSLIIFNTGICFVGEAIFIREK